MHKQACKKGFSKDYAYFAKLHKFKCVATHDNGLTTSGFRDCRLGPACENQICIVLTKRCRDLISYLHF